MTELELLQEISVRLITLINVGVWACRLLCVVIGLLVVRLITLRSPV